MWERRVALVDLDDFRVVRTIDLPFSPRAQWWAPDGKTLVVADAFGGNLAILDPLAGAVRAIRTIHAHNIRALAASADGRELLIAHPMLDESLSTEHSHVFWGSVMGNVLRSVTLDHLLAPVPNPARATPIAHWSLAPLGESKRGAGDPGDLVCTADGTIAVALSGVDEVAVRKPGDQDFTRIPVGRHPTALALSPAGDRAFVANTFDDSISVIDPAAAKVICTIPLGDPPAAPTRAQRGEMLFYDARLSLDGWYSCHTCHTDGHTIGLLNDNFSDNSFGTPKRILSLLGTADTGPWAWNGSNARLQDQIRKSILTTMQSKPEGATDENIEAIAAFLATLKPPPSVDAARGTLNPTAIERGRRIFANLDCARCHELPTYTTPKTYDVHLRDQAGVDRFNPPSLRGVGQRDAFLHDNRAATLRELFTRFKHPDGDAMKPEQLDDLLAFLRSL